MTFGELITNHNKAFQIDASLRMMVPGTKVKLSNRKVDPKQVPKLTEGWSHELHELANGAVHDMYFQYPEPNQQIIRDFMSPVGSPKKVHMVEMETITKYQAADDLPAVHT